MVRTLKTCILVGALALGTVPASAAMLTLPFVGDVEHPDMDPFHVLHPEPAAAPAPAAKPKMHHRMKKHMKKKM